MKLIAHASLWWRRQTTALAALFALIVGTVTAQPAILIGLIAYVPKDLRGFVAGAVAVTVFIIPVLVAHIRQPKLTEAAIKIHEEKEARDGAA